MTFLEYSRQFVAHFNDTLELGIIKSFSHSSKKKFLEHKMSSNKFYVENHKFNNFIVQHTDVISHEKNLLIAVSDIQKRVKNQVSMPTWGHY